MVPRLTSLISLLAWRDQWRFLELTKAHVANGKKIAEIMYSSHNNWVLKVSGLALVLVWFCFIFLCDWSKKLAPLSQTIRYKTTINLDLVCCIFLVFWVVSLFLLWVLRGLFWLNVMITFMTLSLQTLLSKNHFLISNFSIRKVVRELKVLLKLAATWRIIYLCVLLPSAATCLVNDLERMVAHKSHAFHS